MVGHLAIGSQLTVRLALGIEIGGHEIGDGVVRIIGGDAIMYGVEKGPKRDVIIFVADDDRIVGIDSWHRSKDLEPMVCPMTHWWVQRNGRCSRRVIDFVTGRKNKR